MASRQRKNYSVIDSLGNVVPSPTITVYNTGTVTLTNIFSDNIGGGTPLANPFTGGTDGRFFFYASDGQYDVVVAGTGITTYTLTAENFVFQPGASAGGITILNTLTAATQTFATGTSGVNFAINSSGSTHTFNVPDASAAARGFLNSSDWTLFNNKLGNLNGQTGAVQLFATGSVGNDFNIVSAANTHTYNLPTASAANRGLLSSADWTTFNSKQGSLAVGTSAQYVRGDLTNQTLDTSVVPENTNLYYTDARARLSQSATAPLSYVSATGVHSIPKATGAQDGYLASADFTTFTNGLLTTGAQNITGAKTFLSPVLEIKDVDTMTVDATRFVKTSTTTVDTTVAETTCTTITLGGPPTVNRVYRIHTGGDVRVSTGGTDTITYRVYIGGSIVYTTGAIDLTATTALGYDLDIDLTVRTAGGAGVVQANGKMFIADTATLANTVLIANTNTTAIVLTGTPIIKTTVQFSVSNGTNQINERTAVIQILN